MKTEKIYVSFHIGRGGHYHNPGHLSFVGEENFQDLIHRCMDKCGIEDKKWNDDPTEEETILPDDEWKLFDNGGKVILEGRDEIEAMTGRLEWDGIYDTDYVTTTDSLSEKEEEVLWKAYTESAYMSDELKDEICSLMWMKRVHDIKVYPSSLEVTTQDGVETIDIDQQKGMFDEDEWRSDLEDRRFCPFSVELLMEELDRLEMF